MQLVMAGINKSFGANHVLRDVDFSLKPGEIRALLGENGAGKTTLMNILGGVLHADKGEIRLLDQPVRFDTPRDSLEAGIAFIHQELNLVNDLRVYENLFLGRELRSQAGFLDRQAMRAAAAEVLDRMGIPLDPMTLVERLDASYKQVVEIARAMLMKARVIIMDEPTTSLTDVEISRVFAMMRSVKAQGVSIVFISHKLKEALTICDSFTVLRDGVVVADGAVDTVDERTLARHMVGHELRTERTVAAAGRPGVPALEAKGLTRAGAFEDVDFHVQPGEVVGFTGLLGDGRSALFESVFGGIPWEKGTLRVDGSGVHIRGTGQAVRLGLGYVPRNRKENGILKDLSILHNCSLVVLKRLARFGIIDGRRERRTCGDQLQRLHAKMGGLDDSVLSLSGGNQQKVVLAKWLCADPRVMILDNPTQGVDVGAKEEIYEIIGRLAERGVAVVVLSSEAQEILRLCNRAYVLYHGRVQGLLRREELTEENIMVLATGGRLAG